MLDTESRFFNFSGFLLEFTPYLIRGGNDVKKTLNFSLLTVVIAGVAQLVEHNLAKVGVAGSNPVARSIKNRCQLLVVGRQ